MCRCILFRQSFFSFAFYIANLHKAFSLFKFYLYLSLCVRCILVCMSHFSSEYNINKIKLEINSKYRQIYMTLEWQWMARTRFCVINIQSSSIKYCLSIPLPSHISFILHWSCRHSECLISVSSYCLELSHSKQRKFNEKLFFLDLTYIFIHTICIRFYFWLLDSIFLKLFSIALSIHVVNIFFIVMNSNWTAFKMEQKLGIKI